MRIWQSLALAVAVSAPLAFAAALPAAAAAYTVVVENMKFGPVPADLHVGDVITWQNKDVVPHTATARDKSFDIPLKGHGEGTLTLAKAGTFAFFCKYHPAMVGELVVKP